jgi:hypothetical protein
MTTGPSGLARRAETNDARGRSDDPPADGDRALAIQAKADSGQVCKLAQARLIQLRANPNREEVARFARELSCEELRPQVTRLVEMTTGPSGLARRAETNDARGRSDDPPADGDRALAIQAKDDAARSCKFAEAQLAQLRADPNREEVVRFARDLSCEELRPQVTRLLESLGVSLSAGQNPAKGA